MSDNMSRIEVDSKTAISLEIGPDNKRCLVFTISIHDTPPEPPKKASWVKLDDSDEEENEVHNKLINKLMGDLQAARDRNAQEQTIQPSQSGLQRPKPLITGTDGSLLDERPIAYRLRRRDMRRRVSRALSVIRSTCSTSTTTTDMARRLTILNRRSPVPAGRRAPKPQPSSSKKKSKKLSTISSKCSVKLLRGHGVPTPVRTSVPRSKASKPKKKPVTSNGHEMDEVVPQKKEISGDKLQAFNIKHWTSAPKSILMVGRTSGGTSVGAGGTGVVDGEPSYAVENILDVRHRIQKSFFLVKWKGWTSDFNSWEPEEHFDSDCGVVSRFLEKLQKNAMTLNRMASPSKRGRPRKTEARKCLVRPLFGSTGNA